MSSDPNMAPTPAAGADPDDLDLKVIFKRMIVATVVIVGVVLGAMLLFKSELEAVSLVFVDALGGPGIALGYMLPDAFTLPLPNDAFTFFGFVAGMPFWECVMWGFLGSVVGGTIGFFIGRLLQHTHWFQTIMDKRGSEVNQLVKKYGAATLFIAAITPIPFSIACWAVGAGGMRFWVFFLITQTRLLKVALYLWLITEGIINFGQPGVLP